MASDPKNGLFGGTIDIPVDEPSCVSGNDCSQTKNSTNILANTSGNGFEPMDRQSATSSNTLKRNPKMELSKNDLVRLLSYMEGELQAQSIVIAALKSERLKQVVNMGRYRPLSANDPYAALLRDSVAEAGTAAAAMTTPAPYNEQEICSLADQQLEALDNLVLQQRRMQMRMAKILKEAEEKHRRVVQELEEEKRKHEHDTAQGDDITYGLEMERTRLRHELELEKQAKKRNEKDQKKFQECVEDERTRQKQIVLLLLAERKKIIIRYIEERKRSEDLAQILSEEKARIDSMAEGLEEESKKSLRMEAELEKHLQQFEKDKTALKTRISAYEQRIKELENEVNTQKSQSMVNTTNIKPGEPSGSIVPGTIAANPVPLDGIGMPSSVAKVMQPTSTATSVPVSGPTTGIAQTIQSTQNIRSPVPLKTMSTLRQTHTPVSGSPAPHPPPKKSSIMSRGAPPPIPPNKPVVPPKRDGTVTVERRPSVPTVARPTPVPGSAAPVPASGTIRPAMRPQISASSSTTGQIGVLAAIANNLASQLDTDKTGSSSNSTVGQPEIIGTELADFQKILGSMAGGTSLANCNSCPTSSAGTDVE